MEACLELICIDASCPPLFTRSGSGPREGYEPDAATLAATKMGRRVSWVFRTWREMIPTLLDGGGDAIWCCQAITDARRRVVDFSRPYAVFDESVITRAESGIRTTEDLRGRRVGAIAASSNMALAETFAGAAVVSFDGSSADILGEMIAALRQGTVDAVVDDDVALLPLASDPDLEVAFTVPTRNPWGVAVAKDRGELRVELDEAIAAAIADGGIERAWQRWMPELSFPL